MKTIAEHNEEIIRLRNNRTYYSGIECPRCKLELQFTDNTMLLSSPPQKNVKCFECGFIDRVYV